MRVRRTTFVLAICAGAAPLAAQNSQCAGLPTTQNARQSCDAAIDLTRAYHPLAGLLVSGGNAVLGSGATLGGLGKFAFMLRVNATRAVIPNLAVDANNNVTKSDDVLAPAPVLEAAVGLFRGLPGGMLSVDALGAAQFVPNEKLASDIRVDPGAPRIGPLSVGLGFGARVGLLGEGVLRPGISASVMRRGIPRVGFGDLAAGDDIAADVDLHATNLRLVASKRFAVVTLAAGGGWSKYTGTALASFRNPLTGLAENVSVDLSQSRTVAFLDAGLDLKVIKMIGEIGRQSGSDQHLITNFQGYDDTKGTTFYSVGLRFGF